MTHIALQRGNIKKERDKRERIKKKTIQPHSVADIRREAKTQLSTGNTDCFIERKKKRDKKR